MGSKPFMIAHVLFVTTKQVGSKPFMVFQGDAFENNPTHQQLKSLLLDFFCSKPLASFVPAALRQGHVIVLTALPDATVAFRHYRIDAFAVEGRTSPGAQLTEIGPRLARAAGRGGCFRALFCCC